MQSRQIFGNRSYERAHFGGAMNECGVLDSDRSDLLCVVKCISGYYSHFAAVCMGLYWRCTSTMGPIEWQGNLNQHVVSSIGL